MGLIKEPLDVDFIVDPRPLTKEEKRAISEFTHADKEKRKKKKSPSKTNAKSRTEQHA